MTKRVWTPVSYLAPSLILRQQAIGHDGPMPLYAALGIITLPFLWIGMSMSVRRAADAGLSPWFGITFIVPIINYVAMAVLACLPTTARTAAWNDESAPPPSVQMDAGAKRAILAVLVSVVEALGMTALAVYGLGSYGAVLFLVTPCLIGATAARIYNTPQPRPLGATLVVAIFGILAAGGSILLVGIEGLLCLAMAFPIAAALAVLGALVAWAISARSLAGPAPAALVLVLLPGAAGVEAMVVKPELRAVTTSVEIDAPPDAVWPNVIGFSELPAPPEWFFKLGIAYPQRARIDGSGVGAVRHCEFSTGPFVEPVTVWDPPHRLAFDVRAEPPSMQEWSPYAHVNAPHLEGYMVSKQGEFRLTALPNQRTRVEGTTYYTLAIFPESYWVTYSDALLHAIHGRVLSHIKNLSERNGGTVAPRE